MQFLETQVGFLEQFYQGQWKSAQRHGYGIQLFPNGAKFIGNWKKNKCNGFGRLEYINGTFYEGNFQDNCIVEGKLRYFSGTEFEGTFYKENCVFKEGVLTFRDNEKFFGSWAENGIIISGYLLTSQKIKIFLEGSNLVRKGTDLIQSKIIYHNKGCIYEGQLFKGFYDQKGFFYSNFQHPFYFECNYLHKKYNGRYLYHSFFYGFETEEYYVQGKEKGIWKYRTAKGFEYIGDTSTKKQIVKFPFLNQDIYEGDLKIWAYNIKFVSGRYIMNI